ncbi:TadE/TadG family type IV pilus assembly protein [Promicromonospora sp. CA-289599]|uniref:TadE/TadG family type IV pilus assembly protein n=1 Tax=Promicromonospora sp. CA-289599 TaxID=3240014 RepID=UPI003D8F355A
MTYRPRHARSRVRRSLRAGERGSASIEQVFLLPALFTLMFMFVQGAMLYQGRAVALAAAQEGARAAAAEHGTTGAGVSAAHEYVSTTTVGLKGTTVTGLRTATQATVTVTTHTVSLIPGWEPTVEQSATLPVERITG